jgi:hypothetical protein
VADQSNPTSPGVRVVYVHGSGPQPGPADLKRALDQALFGSEQGARTSVAYYADLLHPNPVVETIGVVAEVIAAMPADLNRTPAAVADRLARRTPALDAGGAAFVRRLADALASRMARAVRTRGPVTSRERVGGEGAGGIAVSPRLLPAPIRALLFRILVRFLLRDAHAYFFGGLAPAIHERVRSLLDESEDPAVVIAHSLGSIVAYDVLSEGSGSPAARLLVTVGSPLGIDAVKDQVHQPPRVPPDVAAWLNASDPFDVVAADATVADDYGSVERITDVLVANPAWNPHDMAGYLMVPEVQTAVLEASSIGNRSWNA